MSKYDDTAVKADVLAAARKAAGIYVRTEAPGADKTPERILHEAGSAREILDAYNWKMDHFETIPLDPEGNLMRLYKAQWSILSGYTGTGKTTYLRQLVCSLLKEGKNIFVATLEQDPDDYLIELAATAAGVEVPDIDQLQGFLDAFGSQLKIWGRVGIADHRQILATVRELATAGLDYSIIDSLMCLDVAPDDIKAQRDLAALLAATVHVTKSHLIMVAHPKKKMTADEDPTTDSVAGSSNLGNLAYNVMFIRRGPAVTGNPNVSNMEMHILKRRTKGKTGTISGFFHYELNQFHLGTMAPNAIQFLPEKFYPASGLTEELPEHIMNPGAFRVRDDEPEKTSPVWEL